jgi:putative DNA primase/helicase
VRIATPPMPAGAKPGFDWNDALLEAGSDDAAHAELRKALVRAPVFEPLTQGSVGMSEFMLLGFPQRLGLMGRWLTTTGLAMLVGDPGALKTRLALSMGYAVATGTSLLGWECEHRAPVLFVDGEMPGDLLQQWMEALGPALPDDHFRILAHSILAEQGREMPDLGTQEGRDFLDADIERNASELIILDSLSTLVRSGEDNTMEAWRVVQQWSLRHRQRGRAVLFLHHTNKAGGQRGSSMREVVIDTALKLRLMPDLSTDDTTAVELSYTKGRAIYGQDKIPQILRMSVASGTVEWTHEQVPPKAASKTERVTTMLNEGYETSAIMAETGASKGFVSQLRTKMKAA